MKTIANILLFVFFFTSVVTAQPMGRSGGMMQQLNLTQDQRIKMRELREQQLVLREEHQSLFSEREALWKSMSDTSQTDDVLLEKFKTLNQKQNDLQERGFKLFLSRRSILSPEQFKKFSEIRSEVGSKGGARGKFMRPE